MWGIKKKETLNGRGAASSRANKPSEAKHTAVSPPPHTEAVWSSRTKTHREEHRPNTSVMSNAYLHIHNLYQNDWLGENVRNPNRCEMKACLWGLKRDGLEVILYFSKVLEVAWLSGAREQIIGALNQMLSMSAGWSSGRTVTIEEQQCGDLCSGSLEEEQELFTDRG